MVLIPGLCFLLLWSAVGAWTASQARDLTVSTLNTSDAVAAVEILQEPLRVERRASQVALAASDRDHGGTLGSARQETDSALEELDGHLGQLLERGPGEVRAAARGLADALDGLDTLRTEVDEALIDRDRALTRYSEVLEAAYRMLDASGRSLADHGSLAEGLLAVEIYRVADQHSQADALLAGSIAAEEITYPETAHFTYLTAAYREGLASARERMAPEVRQGHDAMMDSEQWAQVEELSGAVVMRDPVRSARSSQGEAGWNTSLPVADAEWRDANAELEPLLSASAADQARRTVDQARSGTLSLVSIIIAGTLGALLAGAAGIFVALRSSTRLTRRLHRLRHHTLRGARDRLPDIVARAEQGRKVVVDDELAPLKCGSDEIAEVAEAFNTAQRTAVGAAVRQAEIKRGANRVFSGIAYRGQTLIHRQLRLLDDIGATETDPVKRRELARLGHLATRSRRYADNLIILSGAQAIRAGRSGLALEQVLRGAVAEIEEGERIRLHPGPDAAVRAVAVADVVHLLAELMENAAQFSPSPATVEVYCGAVCGGIAVEVEDRGLGMTAEDYSAANRTLAKAPEFDVMALHDEPRLGLFVVARLAERHGIRIRLAASPYGGSRAMVLLPDSVVCHDPDAPKRAPQARMARYEDGGAESGA